MAVGTYQEKPSVHRDIAASIHFWFGPQNCPGVGVRWFSYVAGGNRACLINVLRSASSESGTATLNGWSSSLLRGGNVAAAILS